MKLFTAAERQAWIARVHKRMSSAAIAIEDADGKVLIVKAHYKPYWTLPGGVIDAGETPLEAAIRETKEEVGIALSPEDIAFGWVATRHGRNLDTYQFVFRARLKAAAERYQLQLQASEIAEYDWVDARRVASNDRDYGQVIHRWKEGCSGYVEQLFGHVE